MERDKMNKDSFSFVIYMLHACASAWNKKTAEIYHLSKSTVHNDVSTRLKKLDVDMFEEVQKVMQKNFAEKHIRGGMSTKEKFEREK